MKRLIMVCVAMVALGVAGCQTDAVRHIGTQPITLSMKAETGFEKWKKGGLYFAITEDGTGYWYYYCSSGLGVSCGPGASINRTIDECESRYGRTCKLFGLDGARVWKGPVNYASQLTTRPRGAKQSIKRSDTSVNNPKNMDLRACFKTNGAKFENRMTPIMCSYLGGRP